MSGSRFFEGLLVGGLMGYLFGILSAPKSGADLRRQLADSSEDLYKQASDQLSDLKDKTGEKLQNLQSRGNEALKKAGDSVLETKQRVANRLDEMAAHGTRMLADDTEQGI